MARRSYSFARPNQDDGENITRLELSDDGAFTYSEEWCTYAWNVAKSAKGRWELSGDELTLHVEESENYHLTPPTVLKAVRREGAFDFGGGTVVTLVASRSQKREDASQNREDASHDREDASQKHELEREVENFERSVNIAPSKLVK
ncbi:MAG: lipocalin family protein [Labilithrix sp.]|nr:lipocalin family protein [Labilithrix sp.]